MGGGKETPRQKLIGLMYLVLMALLAMNVSKSILNAFIIVNDKFDFLKIASILGIITVLFIFRWFTMKFSPSKIEAKVKL